MSPHRINQVWAVVSTILWQQHGIILFSLIGFILVLSFFCNWYLFNFNKLSQIKYSLNSTKMTKAECPSTPSFLAWFFLYYTNLFECLCSMVWKKATEEDLFTPFRRTIGSLPWFWVDSGNLSYTRHRIFKASYLSDLSRIPVVSSVFIILSSKLKHFTYFETETKLYLLFFLQTDNILAPMITHGIYSGVVLGHGLWKIHHHRRRLRQRIQQVRVESRTSSKL